MKKSVTSQFVVYIAVLLIVICGSLGLIANATSSNALINSIEQQLPAKAEDGARLVASRIDARLESIITLTKMPAMKSMDWSPSTDTGPSTRASGVHTHGSSCLQWTLYVYQWYDH